MRMDGFISVLQEIERLYGTGLGFLGLLIDFVGLLYGFAYLVDFIKSDATVMAAAADVCIGCRMQVRTTTMKTWARIQR